MSEMKNNNAIKVLQINSGSENYGGVSAMIFEIYNNIDRTKIKFDFVSPKKTTYGIRKKEIEEMGGRIIELNTSGNIIKRKIQLWFSLKKLIKEQKYNIIHINSGSFFFNLEVALVSKTTKVPKIIIHSHNGVNPNEKFKNFLAKIFKPLLPLIGTDFLTCSNKASENMYTKKLIKSNKVITIPNGIETENFKYDENVRNEYREKLNIKDRIVLGNIGRFMKQKNHKFLLEVFKEFLDTNSNAVLLLVGDGELKSKMEDYAKELKIYENVMFLGLRKDIANLLMAMDILVMPSLHEGLPVVGVEAQSTGLPIVFSDNITREVKILENVKYVKLEENAKVWAEEINGMLNKENNRELAYKKVRESGFDIKETVKKIEEIYLR